MELWVKVSTKHVRVSYQGEPGGQRPNQHGTMVQVPAQPATPENFMASALARGFFRDSSGKVWAARVIESVEPYKDQDVAQVVPGVVG